MDDGGVVMDEDEFDGEGGNLGEENPSKCVCNCCVQPDQRKRRIVRVITVKLDSKVLPQDQI